MSDDATSGSGYLARIAIVTARGRYSLGTSVAPPPGGATSARPPSLAAEAMRWSHVCRSRERWRDNADVMALHTRDATATLNTFGLAETALREIAVAGHVVVELPFDSEGEGWDGRIFPWEFVLSRATRPYRGGGPQLTVMRELTLAPAWPAGHQWPASFDARSFSGRRFAPKVLFVQSFPGALAHAYSASEESRRVRHAFGFSADDANWRLLDTPTLDELSAACAAFAPDVVHLAGFDNHQGLQLLRELSSGSSARVAKCEPTADGLGWSDTREAPVDEWPDNADGVIDGYLLRRADGMPCLTWPQQLGQALTAGSKAAGSPPPFFVGLNLGNSAARIAPLLLPEGVLASMGFQDSFDDSLAEYFFENLYARLPPLQWNLPEAFDAAWGETRLQVDLVPGTGIALWARAPLLPPQQQPLGERTARAPSPDWRTGAQLPAASTVAVARRPSPVEALVEPKKEINYAELHNHRPLFDRFELRCIAAEPPPRVHVLVQLHCGPERARFETEMTMSEARVNLRNRIKVPLTATLIRSVNEAVLSTLFVQITVDGRAELTDTYPLRLLPVDQWRDNVLSGKWLPSFVLPRDPAVERAVSAAQRYVRVIRDDPSAGFEGYQSARADDADSLDNVDLQVEAIWATLLHEWQLGYINPPPTYSANMDSQRLRTPSTIAALRMGTCIDLAALFAACLELVDIYPVIFLLNGHALPGYWRHDSFQPEFRAATAMPEEAAAGEMREAADTGKVQRAPWWTVDHAQVWTLIRQGRLAPLETVRLTEHCGFREARQAGVDALRDAADFDSILDIATAREHLITPLPIVGGRP